MSQWLQLALQQLAAEAYFHEMPADLEGRGPELIRRLKYGFNDPLHPYIEAWVQKEADRAGVPNQDADTPYLPGANRMPEVLARAFIDRYEILEQFSNNEFGFSATVLRERTTGQYTLSFKSLEFPGWAEGGDRERDMHGASKEISLREGFAVGQAAAMEEYFQRVSTSGVLAGVDRFNVTGYSLGGHLATLFTVLHPERVIGATTFNAAGHGLIAGVPPSGAALGTLLAQFTAFLRDPEHSLDPARFNGLAEPVRKSLRTLQELAIQAYRRDPSWDPFASENGRVAPRASAYRDPRYEFALAAVEAFFKPSPAAPVTARSGLLDNAATPTRGGAYDLITQIYGLATHDDRVVVANSQIHSGNRVRVFVEDQPEAFATPSALVDPFNLGQALRTRSLFATFEQAGDFGGTHNLAHLIDALSLIEILQSLDPALSLEQAGAILAAGSNRRAYGGFAGGFAEGNSLENTLDRLRLLLVSTSDRANFKTTPWDASGRGFANFQNRSIYHDHLAEFKAAIDAAGGVSLVSFVGELAGDVNGTRSDDGALPAPKEAAELAALARGDLAFRVALSELNPFALLGDALYGEFRAGGVRAGQLDLFDSGTGQGDLTDAWLADRAEFLHAKLLVNLDNRNNDVTRPVNPLEPTDAVLRFDRIYEDRESGYRINRLPVAQRYAYDRTAPRTVFGRDQTSGSETLEGGLGADRLYGGLGDDALTGGAGHDYLEGGRGMDVLLGGAGDDMLLGAKDADTLAGGADFDTYQVRKGDGIDYVIDFDGDGFGGDGRGKIEFLGDDLSNGAKTPVDAGDGVQRWEDASGNRYELVGVTGGTRAILQVSRPGTADGVMILGYRPGDFGITLAPLAPPAKTAKFGTEDNDTLAADADFQQVYGFGGHDRIVVGASQAEARGGAGNDYLTNDAGGQKLYGEAGRDILIASDGADELYGGDDSDALQGGADADYLEAIARFRDATLKRGNA